GAEDEFSNGLAPAAAPIARPRPARPAPLEIAARAAIEEPEPRAAALASRIQIQLGAFVSQEVADAQWGAIKSRNGDLLAGRGRVITPVLSGGRRLFRLRAGPFATVEEASALCRGLKARNEACIVARREN
ncbi:MAG: SPOR domain-containing protein, partial [Pseudomonadota bacterium]